MEFSNDYPSKPPKCKFVPPLYHPNVYTNGNICLSILNTDWRPAITVKQMILGIQDLLDDPNMSSPAQSEAYNCRKKSPAKYKAKIKALAKKHAAK